jgi:hypothetical protein
MSDEEGGEKDEGEERGTSEGFRGFKYSVPCANHRNHFDIQ